jgi:hypothetical protein
MARYDPPAFETEDQVFRLRLAHELQLPGTTLEAQVNMKFFDKRRERV